MNAACRLLFFSALVFGSLCPSISAVPDGNPGSFNVLSYGARGDGLSDDTQAIQQAVEDCAQAGGGRVARAGQTFLAGAVTLRKRVEFHLERGAVLKASPRWRDTENRVPCSSPKTSPN